MRKVFTKWATVEVISCDDPSHGVAWRIHDSLRPVHSSFLELEFKLTNIISPSYLIGLDTLQSGGSLKITLIYIKYVSNFILFIFYHF